MILTIIESSQGFFLIKLLFYPFIFWWCRCEGKNRCSILASNSVFSDPCLGTFKYLYISYSCVSKCKCYCSEQWICILELLICWLVLIWFYLWWTYSSGYIEYYCWYFFLSCRIRLLILCIWALQFSVNISFTFAALKLNQFLS